MKQLEIERIANMIDTRRRNRATVFVCGNGGSAATAEHFTNDLFSCGVKAICLNSNTAIMTMIANDYGYEYVFSEQLEIYAEPGDLLVVFSVSGISLNITEALETGIKAIKIFGGGESYRDAEDKHMIAAHKITEALCNASR